MAAITNIVQHLLRLYGKDPTRRSINKLLGQLPETEHFNGVAYLLHRAGVSSSRVFIKDTEVHEVNYPFLIIQPAQEGALHAIHFHNGTIHELSPGLKQLNNLPGWVTENQLMEILAFDGQALQTATMPETGKVKVADTLMYAGAIILTAILLGAWILRIEKVHFYARVPAIASLLTTFLSVILVFKETGLAEKYTRPFCGKVNYLGCNSLITSPLAAGRWGISLAASGLVHGITLLLYIVIAGPPATLLLVCALLWQVPAIIAAVSLSYKMWKLRTFCKLCILVHSINLVSFSAAAVFFFRSPGIYTGSLTLKSVFIFAGVALLSGWLVLAFYHLLRQIKKSAAAGNRITELNYVLLQQDAAADEKLLQQLLHTYRPLPLTEGVVEDEKPSLLIVISLHCNHCAALMQQFGNGDITDNWQCSALIALNTINPAAGTKALLEQLQQNETTPAARIRLLQQWFATPDLTGMDEPAFEIKTFPFCISIQNSLIDQLPGVFAAGKKIPQLAGVDNLNLALFTRLQQLEAQENL